MIFQKSLAKKKGRAYAFFSGLSSGFVPALAHTLLMFGITFAIALTSFSARSEALEEGEKLSDTIKYIIGFEEALFITENISLLMGAVVCIGILMAIRLFSFAADKRTVNVYYSLGIKRVTLFASKFFAGVLLICAATALPILATYLVNVAFVGPSIQLSLALFHYYVGFSLTALFGFALSLAVFSAVGTVFEGVLFSGVLACTPAIMTTFAGMFSSIFLKNSTVSLYSNNYIDITGRWGSFSESISSFFTKLNPIAFFAADFQMYSSCTVNSEDKLMLGETEWISPDILSLFPWFFAFAGVSVIAMLLFRHRKSETCGFLDSNKPLSNLTLSAVVFACFLMGFYLNYYSYEDNILEAGIIGVIFAVIGYLVADFLLKRRFKPLLKGLVKLPVHLLVVALVIGGFYLSNDYYASYMPDREDIKSVKISTIVSPSTLNALNSIDVSSMSAGYVTYSFSYYPVMLPEMTSEKDINTVLDIHSRLIEECGREDSLKNSQVYIIYELKDGSTKSRKYEISEEKTVEALIACMNSDAVRERTDDVFTLEKLPSGIQGIPQLTYEYSSVTAVSPNLNEGYILNLSEAQFNELKNAIEKDLLSMTYAQYVNAENTQYGFLRFNCNIGYHYNRDDYVIYDEEITMWYPDGEIVFDDAESEDEEYSEEKELLEKTYQDFAALFHAWQNNYDVIISDKMVNTLAYLKSIGCESCFESTYEIKSVSFVEFDYENLVAENDYYYGIDDIYMREIVASCYYSTEEDKYTLTGENKITDKELIADILEDCCLYSLATTPGYICIVEYEQDLQTVYESMFLPASLAPEQVTSYNYVNNSIVPAR